ncbi:MAG: hypothetical protein D8M58_08610 [Calditrichaeota bacterium]|nr:MAG: hypothetical protein DWQ03_17880 [Calditrichota bacterium]MBL1205444.1 hypothetical protein [Calditrichota bacterium]NOG45273.1 hypothetical protein [Calditrichota bacterium]
MQKLFMTMVLLSFVCFNFVISQESEASFISQGDEAYAKFDNKSALESYKKVLTINPENYEANWKTARAYVDIGEDLEDDDERAEYYRNAEQFARNALHNNEEKSNGHLYLGIALGRVALDAGAKQRIKMSKEIKKEADLAIKYNDQNDIAYHVLGRWNRKISNLSWIEKGFADIFLGGVPEDASNEAAISNFKKAIEIKPNYLNHHLELGITYEMMGEDEKAIEAFKKCLELEISHANDSDHKKTAQEFLDDLQ